MKNLFMNGTEYLNVPYFTLNEDSNKSEINPIFPTDLDEFKTVALKSLDFYMKQLGQSKADNVVASAKVDVLLVKAIDSLNVDTSTWSANEKQAWENMLMLSDNGYSDSAKIVDATQGIIDVVALAQTKATAIMSATTHEAIYEAL